MSGRHDDINENRKWIALIVASAALAILALLYTEYAVAGTERLSLARITIIGGDEIVQDSYVSPPRAHGTMTIETDEGNAVRYIDADAWFRGDAQPVWSDVVLALEYSATGAEYEVMSLLTNERYFIAFLRRDPPNPDYETAIIAIVTLDTGDLGILDYRFDPAERAE